jgi:hypothetical protein
MLPLALGIGEAQVDPLDLAILDQLQDAAGVIGHVCSIPRQGRAAVHRPVGASFALSASRSSRLRARVNNSR